MLLRMSLACAGLPLQTTFDVCLRVRNAELGFPDFRGHLQGVVIVLTEIYKLLE